MTTNNSKKRAQRDESLRAFIWTIIGMVFVIAMFGLIGYINQL